MAENIDITILKDNKTTEVKTNGFLLIYLKGEEVKFTGTLELKALAPLLLKLAMEKMKS